MISFNPFYSSFYKEFKQAVKGEKTENERRLAQFARKYWCVNIVWDNKNYQVKIDRSKVFKKIYSYANPEIPNTVTSVYPERDGTYKDAIIGSLKTGKITQELKDGGLEAFLDAVSFADQYQCKEFLGQLLIYFSELIHKKKRAFNCLAMLFEFFQARNLTQFNQLLAYSAIFFHHVEYPFEYPLFEQIVLKVSGMSSIEIQSIIKFESGYEHVALAFGLHVEKYWSRGDPDFKFILSHAKKIPAFVVAGGNVQDQDILSYDYEVLLNNIDKFQVYIKDGGKMTDFKRHYSHYILAIFNHLTAVKNFRNEGGNLCKLLPKVDESGPLEVRQSQMNKRNMYKHNFEKVLKLIDKVPLFLKNRGCTLEMLYDNPEGHEVLLKYAENIPAFLEAGGDIDFLRTIKNNQSILLEHPSKLKKWSELGGDASRLCQSENIDTIFEFMDVIADLNKQKLDVECLREMPTELLKTALEHAEHIPGFIAAGGDLGRLCRLQEFRKEPDDQTLAIEYVKEDLKNAVFRVETILQHHAEIPNMIKVYESPNAIALLFSLKLYELLLKSGIDDRIIYRGHPILVSTLLFYARGVANLIKAGEDIRDLWLYPIHVEAPKARIALLCRFLHVSEYLAKWKKYGITNEMIIDKSLNTGILSRLRNIEQIPSFLKAGGDLTLICKCLYDPSINADESVEDAATRVDLILKCHQEIPELQKLCKSTRT